MLFQKNIILIPFISFAFSCSNNAENIPQEINPETDSIIEVDSAVIKSDLIQTDSTANLVSLKEGTAFYNSAYCNGAPPPEEILQDLKKYKILEKSEIKFVNHEDETIVVYAKTDENGNFEIDLATGKWDYYLTPNINKKYGIDPTCKERFKNKSGSFELKENDKKIPDLHFYFDCDPCDQTIRMRP